MMKARAFPLILVPTLCLVTAILLSACGGIGAGDDDENGIVDWPSSDNVDVGLQAGERAPNFRLETAEGETITLAQNTGKPILLNFFSSWCTSCREEMGAFEATDRNAVTVIGVNLREDAAKVGNLAEATGATYPLALDHDGSVTRTYRVTNLPVTFVLNADGTVREIVRGPLTAAGIEKAVAADSAEAP